MIVMFSYNTTTEPTKDNEVKEGKAMKACLHKYLKIICMLMEVFIHDLKNYPHANRSIYS